MRKESDRARLLLVEYLPYYTEEESRRHNVLPGISGWAQVNGRNAISWKRKFEYDIWYIDNQSFFLDLKIFWLTIYNIINKKGINNSEGEMMPLFIHSSGKEI